jgi:hypothetical protein
MVAINAAVIRQVIFAMVVACIALALPPRTSPADGHDPYCHEHGRWLDGSTRCRWRRTWHGPNANFTPLSPYYIPRPADPCLYGRHGACGVYDYGPSSGCGFAAGSDYDTANSAAGPGYAVSPSLQPGLERLGQIPNDLGIAVGGPMTPALPPAAR